MSSANAEVIWREFGENCNLYEIFGVEKTATEKEITRAYRKLALRYHPDKNRGCEKKHAHATVKFQAISAIHSILNDAEARAFYDETGTIAPSENADSPSYKMWEEYFARIFPKVTEKDIVDFEKEYRFSEEEKKDVLDSYVKYNGRMEDIINTIMLSSSDDEDRFIQMIDKAIDEKIVQLFPAWHKYISKRSKMSTAEVDKKKKKSEAKRAKEAREADALIKAIRDKGAANHLALSTQREQQFSSLLSNLEAKYGNKGSAKKKKNQLKAKKPPSSSEPSEEEFLAIQKRFKNTR